MKPSFLAVRYAGAQSLYWMCYCAVYGFVSVYLLSNGFTNRGIGFLLAAGNIASVLLQPAAGALADRTERITLRHILCALLLLLIACLAGAALLQGRKEAVAPLFGAALALTQTVQPLLNALIFEYINAGIPVNYGTARGIGSFAFACVSLLLGFLLERRSAVLLPAAGAALACALLFTIWGFPPVPGGASGGRRRLSPRDGALRFGRKYDRFPVFLLALSMVFTFQSMSNNYLVQIVRHAGGENRDVGMAMTLEALGEIPFMLGFGLISARFRSGTLIKISGCFFLARSLLLRAAASLPMIYQTQLFQSLAFGVYASAFVYYVNQMTDPEDRVKGQTFVVGAVTLGNVFGSVLGGWLLDRAGVNGMLSSGAAAAAAGCALLFVSVKPDGFSARKAPASGTEAASEKNKNST